MSGEHYLTASEAAAKLRIKTETVCRKAAAGQIPAAKVGRQWLFTEADVDAHVKAQRNNAHTNQAPTRTTTRTKRRRAA